MKLSIGILISTFSVIIVLFEIFTLTAGQYEGTTINGVKVTPAMLYNDCDKRDKRCYGDTDNCLQGRNCTFAASISENRTHFSILMLDSCADAVKSAHYYFAVGLTTLDAHRNTVCREPTFDDFKVFMLWDPVKCEKRNLYAYQMYWTWRNKFNWRQNCDYSEAINGTQKEGEFTLDNYFKKNIVLSSHDMPAPAFAAHVDYKIQNVNQYINRNAALTEPRDVNIARTRDLMPGDVASQSSNSEAKSADSASSNLVTNNLNIIYSIIALYFYGYKTVQ